MNALRKNAVTSLALGVGLLVMTTVAFSQSLAAAARKEKARRAENARTGSNENIVVIDENALKNADGSTFTAVEVVGASQRPRPTAPPAPTSAPETRDTREMQPPAPTKPPRTAQTPTKKTPRQQVRDQALRTHGRVVQGRVPVRPERGVTPIHPTSPKREPR